MINWIKNLFKSRPKEPCSKCKDTGKILRPAMQIGSMTEYDVIHCSCQTKKK